MLHCLKHIIIGSPLPSHEELEARLNKVRALAAFSPGALSSIAYANQEIYLGLVVAGAAGLRLAWPISMAICLLLAIVALSYSQTNIAYPSGGGSYVVAHKNLGTIPGLIAAAALTIDYVLTAAVSLTAGVEAMASVFPILWGHRIVAALFLLAIMTMLNMRGLRESGTAMALPVYLFLSVFLVMLVYGSFRLLINGPGNLIAAAPPAVNPLGLFLVLHAFSTGCTALTGIEAISNGVPSFKVPEPRNANITLGVMTIFMLLLFGGSIGLTQAFAVVAGPQETILSALARRILGTNPLYVLVQISTLAVLAVAANTSFAGFPRLAAILAKDGFLPRQLTHQGDRLVFTNGIMILAAAAAALIVIFAGDSHALIPLFAVGAFLAFTLSQAGMVIHWLRLRTGSWGIKMLINGLGACVTFITVLVVGISKFIEGAWITAILIPSIVFIFLQIQKHYKNTAKQLSLKGLPPSLRPAPPPRVVIPISGVHRAIVDAVTFAQTISKQITVVYVEMESGSGTRIREEWVRWFPDIPLVVLPSPYRSLVGPLIEYLDRIDHEYNDGQLAAVLLPEFVPAKWWHALLHNQTTWILKTALLYRRRNEGFQRVIIDIPYHLKK